nr:hypothetical protein Iba_chr12cCG10260 [Ipomoea batatas]
MDEPNATPEETKPLQANSAMDDDEQRMGSEYTFGTANISEGNGKNGEGCEVEMRGGNLATHNEEYIPECDDTIEPHIAHLNKRKRNRRKTIILFRFWTIFYFNSFIDMKSPLYSCIPACTFFALDSTKLCNTR